MDVEEDRDEKMDTGEVVSKTVETDTVHADTVETDTVHADTVETDAVHADTVPHGQLTTSPTSGRAEDQEKSPPADSDDDVSLTKYFSLKFVKFLSKF